MDFSKFQSDSFTRKDFEFLNSLGHCKSYTVQKAKLIKQNLFCAIKIISKSEVDSSEKLQELISEKETLQHLDHPGIIKLIGTFTDAEYIYFILEFCDNLDFGSFIHRFEIFPFELTRFYAGQLVSVLKYLNSMKVSHGNLNPKNILLTKDRHIKLTDFRNTHQSRSSQVYQDKPDYVAPELLKGGASGPAADLWSLGCIIFELLNGSPPFKSLSSSSTIERIMNGTIEFPLNMTPLAVDFIQSLLLQESDLRIGVNDIDDLTSHIFLQGIVWSKVFACPAPDYSDEMKSVEKETEEIKDKVIKEEIVKKKCGWIYKKRILILLETPCLKYYDPADRSECRGVIEITPQMKVEVKGKTEFVITIPKRSYFFKDLNNNADEWKVLINDLISKVYGKY